MNENMLVISEVGKQTWIVGEDFEIVVPISNTPDQAYAWGEFYGGAYSDWDKDKGVLKVKGHADKEKSGHFIVIAKKGNYEVKYTVYYDAVLP